MDWSPSIRLRRLQVWQYARVHRLLENTALYRQYTGRNLADFARHLSFYDVIVLAGQGEWDLELMQTLRKLNPEISLIRDHCEDVWGLPWEHECFAEADSVVCSSPLLAAKAAEMGYRSHAIEEHYEPVDFALPPWQRPLVTGYMGHDVALGEELRAVAESAGYRYMHICYQTTPIPQGSQMIHWTADGWAKLYSQFRVALLPQRPILPLKSSVKLVQAVGNGMPVICSPLDSYGRIVEHGRTALVCRTPDEWAGALRLMADDDICRRMCENLAAEGYSEKYSQRAITLKWIDHFISLKMRKLGN